MPAPRPLCYNDRVMLHPFPGRTLARPAALIFAALLPAGNLRAQAPPVTAPPAAAPAPVPSVAPDLAGRLNAIFDGPDLRHASVGVLVRSLRDGRVVYERDADLALTPASNQKVLTAAAALARLGPEFRYQTLLLRTGSVSIDGVLQGDLILQGGGDPSLTSLQLGEFIRALRAAGIKRVTGRVIADDSRFDDKRLGLGWNWDDEPFGYQPQVSALNCDRNVLTVGVAPGPTVGARPVVTLTPATAYVTVENSATTVEAGAAAADGIVIDRARGRNVILVSGAIAADAKPAGQRITVEDPALYTAARLMETMREAGVGVEAKAPVRGPAPKAAKNVFTISSLPLGVLVQQFLKNSDNLYGEVLLKTLGANPAEKGAGATLAGAGVADRFLRSCGVDTDAMFIADGSGLSRQNAVTPRNLVTLLTWLHAKASAPVANAFRAALPVGGVDGTLRNRFINTTAQGNVRAKTGSLSGVSALSGYVTTQAGEPLAFSMLMNNVLKGSRAARAAQDAAVLALIATPAP